jgi:HK97 family phage portal protein
MGLSTALARFVADLRSPDISSLELRAGGSLNNPAVPLNAAGFLSFMGGEPTASGEQINLTTAMQQITVQACLRILGEGIASLPLQVVERLANGRSVSLDHPVAHLLQYEPNEEMTAFSFWEAIVIAMAAKGNGYAEIQRDRSGRVVALWPLHPELTTPKRNTAGNLFYETSDGELNGRIRTLDPANILHIPLFSFGGVKGFSPIDLARQGIGLARATEKFGARLFGNGGKPGGVLSSVSDQSPEQQQLIKETWERTQGGENQGRTAVLPGDWKYVAIGITADEAQFLATRGFQRSEIAAVWGIPPHMVGDTARLSGSNHENMQLNLVTGTFRPYLCRIEQETGRKLLDSPAKPAKFITAFDVSERLRGDFTTTQQGYDTGVKGGWYSRNEVRRKLGENPGGPELDAYIIPVNYQNAERLLDTEPIADQPLGGPEPTDPGVDPTTPTQGERSMLGQYRAQFLRHFMLAMRTALIATRDPQARANHFLEAVAKIANRGLEYHGALPDEIPALAKGLLSDQLKAMGKRAANWSTTEPDALAQREFLKVVRSIHINAAREIAGGKAVKQLAPATEEIEDAEDA